MKKSSRIVFFGSGPVAAASLDGIHSSFDVAAVITKHQKGRGQAPVETLATKLGLNILFADNKLEASALVADGKMPDVPCGLVVDYGVILEQKVLDHFEKGIVNSHFSLLPMLRGADPISFAILEGLDKTGVSLMKIVEKLDEGDLIAQESIHISESETTPELTNKLVAMSNSMIQRILPQYTDGAADTYPQPTEGATYTRKLTKEDGVIDWSKPAEQVVREIRAFSGWPKSRTNLSGMDIVITKAHAIKQSAPVGKTIVDHSAMTLLVGCGTNCLAIDVLIPVGKKEMPIRAFLAGYKSRLS